jgi:hypothetical protein
MDIKSILQTLTSLIPFWSTTLIQFIGVGNEYSMLFNIILTQILTSMEHFINDMTIYYTLFVVFIVIMGIKLNLLSFITSKFNFFKSKTLSVVGVETNETKFYPIAMESLTTLILEKYNYKDIVITQNTSFGIVLNNVKDHRLENDLFLNITRNGDKVTYMLSSHYKDLNEILRKATSKYSNSEKKNVLTLYGKEDDNNYYYNNIMLHVTYSLIYKYGMKNFISKNYNKIETNDNNNNNNNNNRFDNMNNNNKNHDDVMLEKFVKNKILLLDECKYFELKNDLNITIQRNKAFTCYKLCSEEINFKNFIKECSDFFCSQRNEGLFKYKLTLSEKEVMYDISRNYGQSVEEQSNKYIDALVHVLINECGLTNYKLKNQSDTNAVNKGGNNYSMDSMGRSVINDTKKQDVHVKKYSISDIDQFEWKNIHFKFNKTIPASTQYHSVTQYDYILESNTENVENFIDECVIKYDKYVKEVNDGKIFNFILVSFNPNTNEPVFLVETLSDKNNKCHETFDHIHCEHKNTIIKNLHKLRDVDYYNKRGLRRKMTCLFHGKPGTGKTATVMAMALEENRHIITVPFNVITKDIEFEKLIMLTEISGIEFTKNKVIYLFDEIDTGLKLNKRKFAEKKTSPLVNDVGVVRSMLMAGTTASPWGNSTISMDDNFAAPATAESDDSENSGDSDGSDNSEKEKDIIKKIEKKKDPIKVKIEQKVEKKAEKKVDKENKPEFNLGKLLSKIDGICNYDGFIAVAITNFKDSLDAALTRDFRFTPYNFRELRKSDAIEIIEKFFEIKLNRKQIELPEDRRYIASKLVYNCAKYENDNLDKFLVYINHESFVNDDIDNFMEIKHSRYDDDDILLTYNRVPTDYDSSALLRSNRLKSVSFNQIKTNEVIQIIECTFDIKLSDEEKNYVPEKVFDAQKTIENCVKFKNSNNDLNGFLNYLNTN